MSGNKRPFLAIAAPARAEAPYLLEWIAYHRVLGVELFFLADNGGADDTSKLLTAFHNAGIALRFDWRAHTGFQLAFYRQAIAIAKQLGINGLFLIDVDEFLRPSSVEPGAIVNLTKDWLAEPTIGAVALNWAIYGSSNHTQKMDGLVIEQFRFRGPQNLSENHHVKTFVRVTTCDGLTVNPHAVVLRVGRYVNTLGQDVIWDTSIVERGITKEVVWNSLRVDHFVVKSRQEFAAKRSRGDMFGEDRDWDAYFRVHDRNDVEDPVSSTLAKYTEQEMQKISSQIG